VIDKIWHYYILENKKINLAKISEEIGISRERIRQIYSQASKLIINKLD
jgi:DNA-directed RNA polymerase sigma subunit (sigma70/sigma32)